MYSNKHTNGLKLFFFDNNIVSYLPNTYINTYFFLKDIKKNSFISHLEIQINKGAQYIKSAGSFGKLLGFLPNNYAKIELPSGFIIILDRYCRGIPSRNLNLNYIKENISKAGTSRRKGVRPKVRGLAMNAYAHPHGGKSGPSRSSMSPWGWGTK
jgi:large subunit ribosomal protein L2